MKHQLPDGHVEEHNESITPGIGHRRDHSGFGILVVRDVRVLEDGSTHVLWSVPADVRARREFDGLGGT